MSPQPTPQQSAAGGIIGSITVEPEWRWEHLRNALKNSTRAAREQFLKTAGGFAKNAVSSGSPGTVANSWILQTTSYMARVYSDQFPPKVHTLESGRAQGAQMPNVGAIQAWANARGIGGYAFVIARAIARRGLKGRFFKAKALRQTRAAIPAMLTRMGRDVKDRFDRTAK